MPEEKIDLPITGMSCANCAMTIERTLKKEVPGVVRASVNLAAERASVEYIPTLATIDDMIAAIEKAGYGAIRPDETLINVDLTTTIVIMSLNQQPPPPPMPVVAHHRSHRQRRLRDPSTSKTRKKLMMR